MHFRGFDATTLQSPLNYFLFAFAFCNPLRVGLSAFRQIFERSQNALHFGVDIFVPVFREILQRDFQNVAISTGRDRQSALAIEQVKRSFLKACLQFAAFQHASVLVAENWQQNLVAQMICQRFPVDIEIRRES
ncbi:MAG: hypothetical protein Udaeo_06360 [Candidatus Udaeobacter sp.]|nr:MAG: hypothetical protein Udaeo_06360 [Candidatus Udaeobacter sp.]